jgi:hypothetical protein
MTRFYSHNVANLSAEGSRTKRVVKYARRMELWEYPQAQRRLPVQWTMWLTHTRLKAPTLEVGPTHRSLVVLYSYITFTGITKRCRSARASQA